MQNKQTKYFSLTIFARSADDVSVHATGDARRRATMQVRPRALLRQRQTVVARSEQQQRTGVGGGEQRIHRLVWQEAQIAERRVELRAA